MESRGVSQNEIQRAREMDLLTYLRFNDPSELVYISHGRYCTKEHDSLIISNGKWMWFSRGFGGVSALDYLVKVKGIPFVQAVKMIPRTLDIKPRHFVGPSTKPRRLLLPGKNESNDKVIEYLVSRGIDIRIIEHCIERGILYESKPYSNAIFLGLDENNIPRYAAYRSTEKTRILGDASGSDKSYSFRLVNPNTSVLHIFESAIDLLSYVTISLLEKGSWKDASYLSLAGIYGLSARGHVKVPKAIDRFLETYEVDEIHIHFDKDVPGTNSAAALLDALGKKYVVYNAPPPYGKDYNAYLQIVKGIE